MPDDYPLKVVREVRDQAASRAEEALAEAVRAHERARAELEEAREALAAFRREERGRRERERERLRSCRASELLREDAFAVRQRERDAALARRVATTRRLERQAAAAVREAETRLGRRAVEREVVGRHERRWHAARAKAAERRRDDELDEITAHKNRQ